MTDNLPAVVSGLLAAFAAVCTRLTREQHLHFIHFLTQQCPATSMLLALSSHLSMVTPAVPKSGLQRGAPGGPAGLHTDSENSLSRNSGPMMGWGDTGQAQGSELEDEHMPSIKEAVVQPIRAELVAQILALRVQPGCIELQKLLPEHLRATSGSTETRAAVWCPSKCAWPA